MKERFSCRPVKAGLEKTGRKQRKTLASEGITLLEMMISIAILAGVMAALSVSVFQTGLFKDKTDALLDARWKNRIVLNLIRSDFQSAYFLENHSKKEGPGGIEGRTGILGIPAKFGETEANQAYFHVHRSGKLAESFGETVSDPEIHEVAYFLVDPPETDLHRLYRSERFYVRPDFEILDDRNRLGNLNEKLTRKNILLSDRAVSFKIRYAEKIDGNGDFSLSPDWDSMQRKNVSNRRMPLAVIVEIVLMDDRNEERKESLLVRLRPKALPGVEWKI